MSSRMCIIFWVEWYFNYYLIIKAARWNHYIRYKYNIHDIDFKNIWKLDKVIGKYYYRMIWFNKIEWCWICFRIDNVHIHDIKLQINWAVRWMYEWCDVPNQVTYWWQHYEFDNYSNNQQNQIMRIFNNNSNIICYNK